MSGRRIRSRHKAVARRYGGNPKGAKEEAKFIAIVAVLPALILGGAVYGIYRLFKR